MASNDRRLARRPQTTIIESSVEPHEEEEEEERDRPRRLRAELLRRPPRFRIELNERSIVALGWILAPCMLAALLIYVINLFTNWAGVQVFSWAALKDAQAVMGAFTFVAIGALYGVLVWMCFKLLKALVELFQEVVKLFAYAGHALADIIGKFQRHGVLTSQPNYVAITDPLTGRPLFFQVSQDRNMTKIDVAKLQELQQASAPQVALPHGPSDECINLSHSYQMHVDEMLSNRGYLLGTSGSGKSSATAVIVEGLTDLHVPYITFDTEGEYGRLPVHMGRGQTIEARHLPVEQAEQFGRYVIENHHQVVLNLLSYSQEDAARVMIGAVTGIRQWEEERGNAQRVAIMAILTEAHKWFPQNLQENLLPPDLYASLTAAFFTDLVRRGRKRGMGLLFDTQKLQEVDKRLLQPDWKVCLRQTEDRSLKKYKEWGILPEEAMNLRNGQGYIYTQRVTKLLAQMNRRQSPDDSKSPGLDSIRRHRPGLDDEIWAPNSYPRRTAPLDGERYGGNGSGNAAEMARKWEMGAEMRETSPEADGYGISGAFPISGAEHSSTIDTSGVSTEMREMIEQMSKQRRADGKLFTLSEISSAVGLGGRKYKVFQAVWQELGLDVKRES